MNQSLFVFSLPLSLSNQPHTHNIPTHHTSHRFLFFRFFPPPQKIQNWKRSTHASPHTNTYNYKEWQKTTSRQNHQNGNSPMPLSCVVCLLELQRLECSIRTTERYIWASRRDVRFWTPEISSHPTQDFFKVCGFVRFLVACGFRWNIFSHFIWKSLRGEGNRNGSRVR